MTTLLSDRQHFFAGNWGDVLLTVEDPLAEWKAEFSEWINRFEEFRMMEEQSFFTDVDNDVMARVHRGWLCSLIGMGEKLGVDLISGNGQMTPNKREQLELLEDFLVNLRSDFMIWHSGAEMEAAISSDCIRE